MASEAFTQEQEGEAPVPVSDLDVAASYAELEIQSMASQLAATVVDVTKPRVVHHEDGEVDVSKDKDGDASGNETETEEEDESGSAVAGLSASEDGDESSDEGEDEEAEAEDCRKLRAEIEAAMEQEQDQDDGAPKTANELAESDVPVRKPTVEITPESHLARCGTILSMNRKSLMATVTTDSGENPLAEGSLLCLGDRSVLGCVDEVFGPVLMPMYLVRFESADKIPEQAAIGQPVFCVAEAASFLVPDQLRGRGTDASNIYDEEADEAVYSDDEAEAAAKHQHRKRNRTDSAPAQLQVLPETRSRSSSGGFFVDYQDYQPVQSGRQRSGSGAWRGQGRSHGHGHHGYHGFFQPIQAQPHGGITRYTSPGFIPGTMSNYPSGPMPPYGGVYGNSYLPNPQFGYQQYGVPPFERPRFASMPPAYYPPAPPLPPDAAEDRQSNSYFESSEPASQYGQSYPPPPPHPASYEYGR